MPDHDGLFANEHFLNQQSHDALALLDLECLGTRLHARKKTRQRFRQAQGGGALGALIDEGAQLGAGCLLTPAQLREMSP
ncbi:MAG: hypothetical protein K9L82_18955 [Chromatiaceae bacterium]|nr:hypothetical protein [Chromatiaceae bacterium]